MAIANDVKFQTALGTPASASSTDPDASAKPLPKALGWLEGALKSAAQAVGQRYLQRLPGARGTLHDSLTAVPDRMQLAAEQARLVLQLLDDVQSGSYRELHWYSLPVAAAALLYAVSPAD